MSKRPIFERVQEPVDGLSLVEPMLGGDFECVDAVEQEIGCFEDELLDHRIDARWHGLSKCIQPCIARAHNFRSILSEDQV